MPQTDGGERLPPLVPRSARPDATSTRYPSRSRPARSTPRLHTRRKALDLGKVVDRQQILEKSYFDPVSPRTIPSPMENKGSQSRSRIYGRNTEPPDCRHI